jgi:hypothetical protein
MNVSKVSLDRWGDELPVPGLAADGHGLQGLCGRADSVELDQRRVADPPDDAAADDRRVGAEDVVADQLHGTAQARGERYPALLAVFAQAVFR